MKAQDYAYIDEYCFEHIVQDPDTARQYSKDGKIYAVSVDNENGYAQFENKRARLGLPGSVEYGNAPEEGTPILTGVKITLIEG